MRQSCSNLHSRSSVRGMELVSSLPPRSSKQTGEWKSNELEQTFIIQVQHVWEDTEWYSLWKISVEWIKRWRTFRNRNNVVLVPNNATNEKKCWSMLKHTADNIVKQKQRLKYYVETHGWQYCETETKIEVLCWNTRLTTMWNRNKAVLQSMPKKIQHNCRHI